MKIRGDDGIVESVKIFLCEDCNRWVVKVRDQELDSIDLLGYGYMIVEIGIAEMPAFNSFLAATRDVIVECIEYYQGKMDAIQEMNDKGEDSGNKPEEHN